MNAEAGRVIKLAAIIKTSVTKKSKVVYCHYDVVSSILKAWGYQTRRSYQRSYLLSYDGGVGDYQIHTA